MKALRRLFAQAEAAGASEAVMAAINDCWRTIEAFDIDAEHSHGDAAEAAAVELEAVLIDVSSLLASVKGLQRRAGIKAQRRLAVFVGPLQLAA